MALSWKSKAVLDIPTYLLRQSSFMFNKELHNARAIDRKTSLCGSNCLIQTPHANREVWSMVFAFRCIDWSATYVMEM